MADTTSAGDLPDNLALSGGHKVLLIQGGEARLADLSEFKTWLSGAFNAPTDILLDGQSVSTFDVFEGLFSGTKIATLSAVDADASDTHTFSIVSGNDDGYLQIVGDELQIDTEFLQTDAATIGPVTLRVTDSSGFTFDKAINFVVQVSPADIPVNTVLPALPAAAPTVGADFTATNGTWTAEADTIYEYQWFIDLIVPISEATARTYVPVDADVGRKLRLRVRAIARGRDPVEVYSAESLVVVAGSGPGLADLTVLTDRSTETSLTVAFPAQDPVLRYQLRWRVGTGSFGSAVNIVPTNNNETGSIKEYTQAGLLSGTQYNFQHRWEQSSGVFSAWTPATGTASATATTLVSSVPVQAPVNTTPPSLVLSPSGSSSVGVVLSGDNGVWQNNPEPLTFAYKHYRVDGNGVETEISGAVSSTYTTTTADIGFRVRRAVLATNSVDTTEEKSAPTGIIAPAPTTGIPSSALQIELAPPNLDNPRSVVIPGTGSATLNGSVLQDAIITSSAPSTQRSGTVKINGFANAWADSFEMGTGRLWWDQGRGEKCEIRVVSDQRYGSPIDPRWFSTTIAESGLPHRWTVMGGAVRPGPGTWQAHSAIYITSGVCSALGVWNILATAHRSIQSAKVPQVGEVLQIVGGDNPAAVGRWFRINFLTSTGGNGADYTFNINATDVTETFISNYAITTSRAHTGYAIREFRCEGGQLFLQFAGITGVEAGTTAATGKGVLLQQVYKANGDRFYEANTLYHIVAFDTSTFTATLAIRNADAAVTGTNFTIPGDKVKCVYYDTRFRATYGISPHPDAFQILDHSLPVEFRCLTTRPEATYQILRHNGRAKLIRFRKVYMSRVDMYDTPEIFPMELRSQLLDLNNASTANPRQFVETYALPDAWRSLVNSQVAEPTMQQVPSQNAVYYAPGQPGSAGFSGQIDEWDPGTNPSPVSLANARTNSISFAMSESDAAPSAINWRIIATGDIRSVAQNTVLAERFIVAPRRGLVHTVTMTDTASGRFQIHTVDGGPSRCIARGAAALTAGTYQITIRVVTSSPFAGHTAGFTTDFDFDIVINSDGRIGSITAA